MSGFMDQALSANVIDATLGTSAFVATSGALHCRLMTTNGTASTNGTELATSGSYVAGTGITPVSFAAATPGAPSQAATSADVTQTGMPAATIVGVELWDSAGTPKRKWGGPTTASKTTNVGDTYTIPAGSLTVSDG